MKHLRKFALMLAAGILLTAQSAFAYSQGTQNRSVNLQGSFVAGSGGVTMKVHGSWLCDDDPNTTNSCPIIIDIEDGSRNVIVEYDASIYGSSPPGTPYVNGNAYSYSGAVYSATASGSTLEAAVIPPQTDSSTELSRHTRPSQAAS